MRFVVDVDAPDKIPESQYNKYGTEWLAYLKREVVGIREAHRIKSEVDTTQLEPRRGIIQSFLSNTLLGFRSLYDLREKGSDAFDPHAEPGDKGWIGRDFVHVSPDEPDAEAQVNLISSRVYSWNGNAVKEDSLHEPLLDIDIPVTLTPSKTPGHHHLHFPGIQIDWPTYQKLLYALKEVGIIQRGYYYASLERHCTFVRAFPTPTGFQDDNPWPGWPNDPPAQDEDPVRYGPFDNGYKPDDSAPATNVSDEPGQWTEAPFCQAPITEHSKTRITEWSVSAYEQQDPYAQVIRVLFKCQVCGRMQSFPKDAESSS